MKTALAAVIVVVAGGLLAEGAASHTAATGALFISPSGSDGAACSKGKPCATLERAFRRSKPGQSILLMPGDYNAQALGEGGPSGRPVTVAPAQGKVTVESLTIEHASDLILKRVVVKGQLVIENEHPESPGSTNITLLGMRGKTLRLIGRISKISVRGGSWGPAVNAQPQIIKYNPDDADVAQPTQILIDGVSFHDFRRTDDTVHTECLQILNGINITVRRSRFWNCDGTGDIGITPLAVITNLTLENNFIGGGGDTGYGIQIGMKLRNFVFRYNSSSQSVFFADTEVTGPYTFVGNYMPWDYSLCNRAATYVSNVLEGGKCGSSDVSVPALRFVAPKAHDLHTVRGSSAIGRGSQNGPSVDIDGDLRPSGFALDAGADQRETALLAPGRSIGRVVLGSSAAGLRSFYGGGRSGRARVAGVRLRTLSYRVHRGALSAYLEGDRVVGVATTTGYYRSAAGLSAGRDSAALRGFSWVPCVSAYVRPTGGSTRLVVKTTAGRRGGNIAWIGILRAAYAGCGRSQPR
jgi:hypothetical protein